MTKGNGLPCKKCGTSEWYDSGRCKACERSRKREWKRKNKKAVSEYNKKYRDTNPDYAQNWKKNNPEKVKQIRNRCRDWQKKYNREHYQKNKHKKDEQSKQWKKENREKANESTRAWFRKNPGKRKEYNNSRRTRKTKAGGRFTSAEWNGLCDVCENRCLKCGKTFHRSKLTADHVIPVSLGGTSNIDNIQPLCKPCNSSKGVKPTDYRKGNKMTRWIQRNLL